MLTKIKENVLKTIKDKKFYMFLITTLLFFGIFIVKQYATDSYTYFNTSSRELLKHILSLGRIVTGIFWAIFSFTNYDITYIVSFILAITFTTLSMYKLNEILSRDIKNEKLTIIISILTIINICILELYMYLEKGILILSVYLNILAIGNIDEALKGNKKAWIKIFIEMLIANCCYQGTVALFVAIGTIYIIKNSKNIIEFIKNNVIVAILYGLPALCNFLIIKLVFNGSRLEKGLPLLEKVSIVLRELVRSLINSFKILPNYVFLGFIGLISFIFIIKLILEKKKNISSIILNIFFLGYIILGTVLTSGMPQILQSFVYIVPRNMYAFGALFGIILIFVCQKVNITKIFSSLIIFLGICFLIFEFYNFSMIIIEHYYTNIKDNEIAEKIVTIMKDYEEKSGNLIQKIRIYKPDGLKTTYKNVTQNGDGNVRLFYTEWGIQGILNRLMKRNFEIEYEKDSELDEYFKSQNFDDFDEKQVVFDNNIMNLYIYNT